MIALGATVALAATVAPALRDALADLGGPIVVVV